METGDGGKIQLHHLAHWSMLRFRRHSMSVCVVTLLMMNESRRQLSNFWSFSLLDSRSEERDIFLLAKLCLVRGTKSLQESLKIHETSSQISRENISQSGAAAD